MDSSQVLADASVEAAAAATRGESFQAIAQEVSMILALFTAFFLCRKLFAGKAVKKRKSSSFNEPMPTQDMLRASDAKVLSPVSAGERSQPAFLTPQRNNASVPAARAAEQQMIRLLEQREFTRALNIYRACERDGRDALLTSELFFSSFIQAGIRVGKADVVERVLRTMRRNGLQPSVAFWQTVLRMLASRKQFHTVVAAYVTYADELPVDRVVYSCCINGALETAQPRLALEMLPRYTLAGLDAKEHVLHFRTYAAVAEPEPAIALFEKLAAQGHATPLMLNLSLLACVSSRQPDRAAELLDRARAAQAKRGQERLVDAVSYNTLIKGYAKEGARAKCFDCLRQMKSHDVEPDDVTFASLLDLCAAEDSEGANEILALLGKEAGAASAALLLRGLVRSGGISKALELYAKLRAQGAAGAAGAAEGELRLDMPTYAMLVKAYVDAHDLEGARGVVRDLEAAGLQGDDVILTHLLEGCRHLSDAKLGTRLFEDFLGRGGQPSEYTLITLLKLYGRCGVHGQAYNLVQDWEVTYGQRPTVIHFTCLMSGCLRTKSYDRAWEAYELMLSVGVQPDRTAMTTLIPGMLMAQQWARVLEVSRRAVRLADPPIDALQQALAQLQQADAGGRPAEQLEAMLRSAGLPARGGGRQSSWRSSGASG